MQPVTPTELPHTTLRVFGKDQPDYDLLPGRINEEGEVTTEWIPTEEEQRALWKALNKGRIRIRVTSLTFNKPLNPLRVDVVETV